jgi:hypothetical protein
MYSRETIFKALVYSTIGTFILAGILVNFFPQTLPYIFKSAPYILKGFRWLFGGLIMILIIGFLSSFVWVSSKEKFKEMKVLSFNKKIKVIIIDIIFWGLFWCIIMLWSCKLLWKTFLIGY